MENVQSTGARLRRTFQYPTDDSSSADSPDVLDEEEQENLIAALAATNAARNAQFRLLLLALPLLSTLPYLIALPRRSAPFLLSMLSISSLLSTAYLLHRLPPTRTGIRALDTWSHASAAHSVPATAVYDDEAEDIPSTSRTDRRRRRRASSFSFAEHRSPLETHLPYLNVGLCAVLMLTGLVAGSGGEAVRFDLVGLGSLPAVVYGVVLVAKMVMAGVDPEAELGGLRYEYKGA